MKEKNCIDSFSLIEHRHQIDVLKAAAKQYKGKTIENIIQQMEAVSEEMLKIRIGL